MAQGLLYLTLNQLVDYVHKDRPSQKWLKSRAKTALKIKNVNLIDTRKRKVPLIFYTNLLIKTPIAFNV